MLSRFTLIVFFFFFFSKKIACGKNYVHVIWPRVFCAMMILAHEMRLFFIFFEWVGATKCAAENNKHVFIETAVFSLSIIRLRSGFFANSPSAQHYNCQWVFFIYAHDARYWLKRKYSHENKKWTEYSLLVYLLSQT